MHRFQQDVIVLYVKSKFQKQDSQIYVVEWK